jgi:hypothetical protein
MFGIIGKIGNFFEKIINFLIIGKNRIFGIDRLLKNLLFFSNYSNNYDLVPLPLPSGYHPVTVTTLP